MLLDDCKTTQEAQPAEMPETMVINGVTYRREFDWVDKTVSEINEYQELAQRTGLTLRQAYWFCHPDHLLPD